MVRQGRRSKRNRSNNSYSRLAALLPAPEAGATADRTASPGAWSGGGQSPTGLIGTTDPVELDAPVEPLELDEPVEPDDPVEPVELDGQRARLGVDGAGSATLNAGKRGAGRVRWRLAAGSVLVVLAMVVGGSAILLLQLAAASNQSQDLRGLASPKVSVPAIASGAGDSEQDPVSGQKGGGTGAKADSANPGRGNAEGSAPAGTAGPTSAGSVTVLVHVAGAVVHPGIVELPANSRVYQAIQRAGGEAPDAALDAVNLAAPLQDGEQLVVPTRQQADNGFVAGLPAGAGAATGTGASATSGGTGGGTNGNAKAGSRINLNTATEEELATLPRVGPVLAQRIIAWRVDHGRFSSVQELDAVEGVGPKMLESLLPLVTV